MSAPDSARPGRADADASPQRADADASPQRADADAGLRERIHAMPKAELHVHLDGSLRPSTVLDLARRYDISLPSDDEAGLEAYLSVREPLNLEEYLARFGVTLSVMQHAEALERVAFELCEDAAAENVRYIEIRFSPILHTRRELPLPETVEAPLRGIARAHEAFGIRGALIICGIRNMSPDVSRDLADLTVAFKERGVVGFDLAGAEYNYPAKKHKEAFYRVLNANVAATIHAGEAYGPESIHQALHYCGAHRIGHGTRLFEDPELMRYVNDHRIPLEICLTSNVQTGAVPGFADHPVRRYYDVGIPVSLHTDNRLMSATTLTEEYVRAAEHLAFSLAEVGDVVLNGFRSAFLHWPEKVALLEEVGPRVRELTTP